MLKLQQMGILLRNSFFPNSTHVILAKVIAFYIEEAEFKHILKDMAPSHGKKEILFLWKEEAQAGCGSDPGKW